MLMVLVSHKELHDNMRGLMQLDYKKTSITFPAIQEPTFVPVVPIAHSKYRPLLAVTTTVNLDVQTTIETPFTQMMFCGTGNNVEL